MKYEETIINLDWPMPETVKRVLADMHSAKEARIAAARRALQERNEGVMIQLRELIKLTHAAWEQGERTVQYPVSLEEYRKIKDNPDHILHKYLNEKEKS